MRETSNLIVKGSSKQHSGPPGWRLGSGLTILTCKKSHRYRNRRPYASSGAERIKVKATKEGKKAR